MNKQIFRFPYFVLLLLSLILVVAPALAQDEETPPDTAVTDDEVNAVAKDIYCPVCENTPLDVCATQACADWRELIRTKLAEGQSPEDIFSYFARQYGDGVLANPPQQGMNLVILWILPVALVLVGALLFSRYMRRLREEGENSEPVAAVAAPLSASTVQSSKPAGSDADYVARIENEIQQGD